MVDLKVCKYKSGSELQRCLKKEMPKVIGYHIGAPSRSQKKQRGYKGALKTIHERANRMGFDSDTASDIINATQGVLWGDATGRTSGSVWWNLEHMKDKDVVDLVSEIAKKRINQNDVPRYLNKKFGE